MTRTLGTYSKPGRKKGRRPHAGELKRPRADKAIKKKVEGLAAGALVHYRGVVHGRPLEEGFTVQTGNSDFEHPDIDSDKEYRELLAKIEALPKKTRHKLAGQVAKDQARYMAADLVRDALDRADHLSLRDIRDKVGIDPSQVSLISSGALDEGPHLHSLARIAMALGKHLVVSFE